MCRAEWTNLRNLVVPEQEQPMQADQELLNRVRPYCDSSTGEVVERIPEELMKQLRTAKLARGIPRCRSTHTQTNATWFVFFSEEIRQQVMAQFRAANQKRNRARKAARPAPASPAPANPPQREPRGQRGLTRFRSGRRPNR